jgi:hypothetical protein
VLWALEAIEEYAQIKENSLVRCHLLCFMGIL